MSEATAPLARLVETVRAAANKADKGAAVGAWMRDRAEVEAAAAEPEHERASWLLELGSLPGMAESARRVRDRIALVIEEKRASGGALRVVGHYEERPALDVDGQPVDLPVGYRIAPGGELLRDQGGEAPPVVVAHRALAIVRRWVDHEVGREVVDLAWRDGEGGARDGAALDVHGRPGRGRAVRPRLPVSSVSAGEVVRYLRAQVEGLGDAPGVAVSRCGWVGRDFVAGASTVMGGSEVRVVADEGAKQIARGIGTAGTWEGWCAAVAEVADRPLVMMAIYGAVAASMLRPLGISGGCVLHWSARTSQGKTTALRVAASVWGDPMAAGMVGSWDSTAKKIEETALFLCDLPTMLDETSHIPAHGREAAARLVYALASGRGRGRGTRGGSDAVAEYRTVGLSTGEAPLTSWCSQDGIAARVLEMTGAPCESAGQAQALVWAVSDHYGHLGPRIVAWLARQDWATLRARYRARVAAFGARSEAGGVGARLGEVVALLEASALVCRALGVPGDPVPIIEWAWTLMQAQARGADEGARALEVVRSQLAQHADQIQRPSRGDGDDGATGSGRCVARDLGDGWIAVSSVVVEDWWRRAGLDPAAMRQRWADRGWMHARRVYLLGSKVSCFVVADGW
jgi:hypothetical protein